MAEKLKRLKNKNLIKCKKGQNSSGAPNRREHRIDGNTKSTGALYHWQWVWRDEGLQGKH